MLSELRIYNEEAKEGEKKRVNRDFLKSLIKEGTVLVAYDKGRLIGFMTNELNAGTLWADWIYVEKKYRSLGLGMTFNYAMFTIAEKKGAHKIWTDCRTNNRTAIKILKSLRFKQIAKIKGFFYGQDFYLWESDVR